MKVSDIFRSISNDKVSLIKKSGEIITDIAASVQSDNIFIEGSSLPIEEGDTFSRVLPSGLTEKYIVIDSVFFESIHRVPAHYQVKVEKQTSIKKPATESIVLNSYGHNARINYCSTDNSTNVVDSITENNVFEKLRETIEQQVTSEDKDALLSSVDQLEQTKGTSKYNAAYKSFMQSAKDWTQILTPYLAILVAYING